MGTQIRHTWRGSRVKRYQTRLLRSHATAAEARLWQYLRNRQLGGTKFRRQHVLRGYIVDFVSIKHGLIIELDGAIHDDQIEQDTQRTQVLESAGYRVLRFTNDAIEQDIKLVLRRIAEQLG